MPLPTKTPIAEILSAYVAYIYAGLRREEALWLTVDDRDLETGPHGMIRVRAKTVEGQSWQPKTKVNRVVPVSSALRAYLDRYFPRPESLTGAAVTGHRNRGRGLHDCAGGGPTAKPSATSGTGVDLCSESGCGKTRGLDQSPIG